MKAPTLFIGSVVARHRHPAAPRRPTHPGNVAKPGLIGDMPFPTMRPVNTSRSHEWVDRRSLALAREIAAKLAREPALFAVARENLRRWKASMDPCPADLREWEEILAMGEQVAIARLTEDSPRGRRLRQSNPFAGVLTPQQRKAVFDFYESIPA